MTDATEKPELKVVAFKPKKTEISPVKDWTPEEWVENQALWLDKLYAGYLKARSKCLWFSRWKEGEIEKATFEHDDLFWVIVAHRAYRFDQVEYKFEMLREVIDCVDDRRRALVESIRLDLKFLCVDKHVR